MAGLLDLWSQGQVVIVRAVGYSQPNFSHFVSTDI
jgi:uncharacterized protein (DUF1501 family)